MNDGSQQPPYGQPPAPGAGAFQPQQGGPQQQQPNAGWPQASGYGPPPGAQGYGAQSYGPAPIGGESYRGGPSASAFQGAYAPYAAAAPTMETTTHRSQFGDAAGEYLHMQRGRFNAWPYVVLAFLGQAGMMGAIPAGLAAWGTSAAGGRGDVVGGVTFLVGAIVGLGGAYFTFRDRWKCIEAFSSRFCAGIMNISLLYVPIIAFVYANVRGVQKLLGK